MDDRPTRGTAPDRIPAPELDIERWFNTPSPITLADRLGKVVVLHAFQMLCPGCVLHGTPLAQRLHDRLAGPDLSVIGIHTVFEHHEAMTPTSLEAYLYEFKITMPIGVDRHVGDDPMPATMAAYQMRGTPSLVIIDRNGSVRHNLFGNVDELALGYQLAMLVNEPRG